MGRFSHRYSHARANTHAHSHSPTHTKVDEYEDKLDELRREARNGSALMAHSMEIQVSSVKHAVLHPLCSHDA